MILSSFEINISDKIGDLKISSIDEIKNLLVKGNDDKPINIIQYINSKLTSIDNPVDYGPEDYIYRYNIHQILKILI
jgi:hypothetical protein